MKKLSKGFGLIEIMVALTLGLIVVLGITQIFLSTKTTFVNQTVSAGMQEDARFVFSKMLQEIRMVGMFGCLSASTIKDSSTANDFAAASFTPISWDNASQILTLVTADVGLNGGPPTWSIVSDCLTSSTAYTGVRAPVSGQIAMPIRKLVYTYKNNQIFLGPAGNQSALVNNVSAFSVSFGIANSASDTVATSYSTNPSNPALIRSVRLTMTLTDPTNKVRNQTFNVVAALRNRLR